MKLMSKLGIKSAAWLTLGLAVMSTSGLWAEASIDSIDAIVPQTGINCLGEITFTVTLTTDEEPPIDFWNIIVEDVSSYEVFNLQVPVEYAGTAQYTATGLFASGSDFTIIVDETVDGYATEVASLSYITVPFVAALSVIPDPLCATCDGADDGQIKVTVSDGTPPYTVELFSGGYLIDSVVLNYDGEMHFFTDLDPEDSPFSVTVTDANDCPEIETDIVVGEPAAISNVTSDFTICILNDGVPLSATTNVGYCQTLDQYGNVVPMQAGGVWTGAGVEYDDGAGNAFFNPSAAGVGTHTLTFTAASDPSGYCFVTVEATVVPDPVITIDYGSALSPYCCDDTNDVNLTATDTVYGGQWSISPTPGVGGFTPDNNAGTAVFNPAAAGPGSYDITFSNEVGYCLDTITLVVLECLEVIVESRCATCFGFDDGEVEVTVTGGLPPYTINFGGYNFDDQVVSQYGNEIFGGLIAGDYTVAVIDSNGCTSYPESFDAVVGEPSELVISAADSVTCFSDPLVALTAITSVYGCSELEAGGVWTGAGVEYDDGAGNAFFNPGAAGAGTHTLRFTANSNGYGECFDELDITVYPDLLVETAQELEACRDDEFCYNITITNPSAQPPQGGDSGFVTVTGLLDPAWSVTQVIDCTTVEDSYNNQGGGLWTNPLDAAITLQTAGTGTWTIGVLEPGESICLKLCGIDPNVGNKTLDIKVVQTIPQP